MSGKSQIGSITDPSVLISGGVPAIWGLTSGGLATESQYAALAAATAEAAALSALQSTYDSLTGYYWGLFPNKSQSATLTQKLLTGLGIKAGTALFPDALVLQLGVAYSTNVAQAPLEQGEFLSYNKTANPARMSLTMSFQGTAKQRSTQLQKLEALCASEALVAVRMPEGQAWNMNVVNINIDRNTRMSANLLIVTAFLEEVRAYAVTTQVSTKTGSTTVNSDQGSKQTQSASDSQSYTIESGGLY